MDGKLLDFMSHYWLSLFRMETSVSYAIFPYALRPIIMTIRVLLRHFNEVKLCFFPIGELSSPIISGDKLFAALPWITCYWIINFCYHWFYFIIIWCFTYCFASRRYRKETWDDTRRRRNQFEIDFAQETIHTCLEKGAIQGCLFVSSFFIRCNASHIAISLSCYLQRETIHTARWIR